MAHPFTSYCERWRGRNSTYTWQPRSCLRGMHTEASLAAGDSILDLYHRSRIHRLPVSVEGSLEHREPKKKNAVAQNVRERRCFFFRNEREEGELAQKETSIICATWRLARHGKMHVSPAQNSHGGVPPLRVSLCGVASRTHAPWGGSFFPTSLFRRDTYFLCTNDGCSQKGA